MKPDVQNQLGEAIRDLQKDISSGLPLNGPMPTVASGAHELRVRGKTTAIRVFYFVKLVDAIVGFHAFQKKTPETPAHELAIGRQRLNEVLHGNV